MGILAALGLRLDAKGAIRSMGKFTHSATNAGRATEKFERTTKNLSASLGALGALFGTRQLVQYADTWTLISARINVTADSSAQMRTIQMRLYDISQKTRNTLAATAVLYTRVALNADQLGRSSEELLLMTESVNAAMLISGSTGVEAAQSIRQLAQAMSKGKLDGDEFRTVMEAMPLVARALADEMGVTIGELQALAPQGLLTVQELIDALIAKNAEFMAEVEKMPWTIGQSIEVLNNAFTMMFGILNQAAGVSATFGKSLRTVADNMDRVAAVAGALLGVLVAHRTVMFTLNALQAIYLGYRALQNWVTLSRHIGKAAAAMHLLSTSARGVQGIVIAVIAASVGLVAYKILLKQITDATEEWMNANEDLSLPFGDEQSIEAAAAKRTRQRIEDIIREAHQTVVLAGLVDEAAERQEIAFDAINQRIEARRDLTGQLLAQMEEAIDLEEELAIVSLEVVKAIDAQQDALDDQRKLIDQFLKNIQRSFADTFEKIFEDGISKFSDFFDAIKKLFVRLLSEMAAAKMMQTFQGSFTASLENIFGVTDQQEAIKQAALDAANEARLHMMQATTGGVTQPFDWVDPWGTPQKAYDPADPGSTAELGLTYEVEVANGGELGKQIAKYMGPAIAGFMVGQMIGSTTENVGLGTLGGAAGGAAMGAQMAGPWGAVVGGIAGAIGGFLGASEKQRQATEALRLQLEKNALITEQNNVRLREMRAFGGDPNRGLKDALLTTTMQNQLNPPSGRWAQPRNLNALDPVERALLMEAAKLTGIKLLDDQGVIVAGALSDLAEALGYAIRDLTKFSGSLQDQLRLQSNYNKIFGIEETPKQQLLDTQSIMKDFAPELMKQLGLFYLDMNSKEARATLLAGLRDMFTMITDGDMTLELLDSFADKDQLIDMILKTVGALEGMNKMLFNVTTDFPRAMDLVHYEQLFGSFGTGGVEGSTDASTNSSGYHAARRAEAQRLADKQAADQRLEEQRLAEQRRLWMLADNDETEGASTFNVDSVTIVNQGDETGEELLAKLEAAVITRRTRGGSVTFTEDEGWD